MPPSVTSAPATQADVHAVRDDLHAVRDELHAVRDELHAVRDELRADVAELKTDVAELKTDVAELKTDVAGLETAVTALDQRTERNDNLLATAIAELTARVVELSADLPRHAAAITEQLLDWMRSNAEGIPSPAPPPSADVEAGVTLDPLADLNQRHATLATQHDSLRRDLAAHVADPRAHEKTTRKRGR